MTPEQELEELYQRAQDDLAHAIEQTEPEGTQTEYEGRLLFHITMILAGLYISTERWTFANMAGIYWTAQGGAHQDMLQQHQASGQAPPPFDGAPMPLDTDAVSLISRNLNADLTNTIDHVGRVLQDEVRQAGVGATLRKASAAETVRQTKQNLLRMLQDRGIPAIEYMRAGERCFMQLKSYSALVARSTIREATNTASINYSMKIGSDLVKISTHFGACPVCVPYEGRVYSISGDNPHYPSLYSTPFSRQYKTFHPN